jgi:RNA polymerase sigma factor (sigma-70 family)
MARVPRGVASGTSLPLRSSAAAENSLSESELLSYLAVADRAVSFVCARYLLTEDQKEEFSSHVTLKLLDDNHAILRKFENRSSIRTYLGIVIDRIYKDYRNAAWGKWRPSTEAVRNGEIGILLERLLTRDCYSFEEAYELITTNHQVAIDRSELEELAGRLPVKMKRRLEGDDALAAAPDANPDPQEMLLDQARAEKGRQIVALLSAAIKDLPERDQLLLTLRFEDGRSVAHISLMLGEDQKGLYRRFDRLVAQVGEALKARGVTARDVADLFEDRPRRSTRRKSDGPSV